MCGCRRGEWKTGDPGAGCRWKVCLRGTGATAEHAQAMHDVIKSFMEMDFASYLLLGELDIGGLRQICDDPDSEEGHPEGGTSHAGPSSTPQ
ncbi:unnamed protein product [Lactuca virosa]|uniref:Uncharacterized protein n=1 Tax=Lactuca virosa TaxID=75947 RepID=A0AAU9PC50_9ASTR|nr:unnamed protein product [Lactuca virosa]